MNNFFNPKVHINYLANTHIPQLDGVRGLAIFLVLLFHCFPFIAPARLGWLGVDLFFVLSGFLITGILWDTKEHKDYYKNFLVRRMVRIFPLYYAVLVLYFFVLPAVSTISVNDFSDFQSWFWLYATNWLFVFKLQDWIEGIDINHFWSLAIEEQFYLFWPFVVYLCSRKGIFRIVVLLVVASFLFRFYFLWAGFAPISIYVSTITRVDGLVIGAAIALCVRDEKLKGIIENHVTKLFFITGFLILLFVALSRSTSPYSLLFMTVGYTVNALFFACVMLFSMTDFCKGMFKKMGLSPVMRFLGKYSYSLYVFHLPIYSYFNHSWFIFFMKFTDNVLLSRILTSFLVIFATVMISLITWVVLEKPFLKLKKYYLY